MYASYTSTDTLRQAECMARRHTGLLHLVLCLGFMVVLIVVSGCAPSQQTSETSPPVPRDQLALLSQKPEEVNRKNAGCLSCHAPIETPSMHRNPAVQAACVDCHGGAASVFVPAGAAQGSAAYEQAKMQAHVQPRFPKAWRTSANPEHTYTLLLKESPEFVRFINPGDLRVAQETCGQCHAKEVTQVRASLHTTSGIFWTAAAYNNGIWPFKTPTFGESYNRDGIAQSITMKPPPTEAERRKGVVPVLLPLPRWEILKPGDVFRVFEDGGLLISPLFTDLGNPQIDDLGGKPDIRQSIRGLGTGLRISVPVLNLHKTRLNDPHLSFLGTNDHPGDYRSSGCTACHTIYANDRDPWNSGPYAEFGNGGRSATKDPTIPKNEPGHPIRHELTRAIPTSQCMVCHMHQPNVFVNPFLGYQMWDYETDGEVMWPKEAKNPSDAELFKSLEHNPEEAAARGLWSDKAFLAKVWELNPQLKHTQFADYHGHGWNFKAVFKRDRKGNFLDAKGAMIPFESINGSLLQRAVREPTDRPEQRAGVPVHMKDIHLEKGMHCVDCHFEQDGHGNGKLHGGYVEAIEIACIDCHGGVKQRATLRTTGLAAPAGGNDLARLDTPWGARRFVWRERDGRPVLLQRSMLTRDLEWEVVQVMDSIDPQSRHYSEKSRLAKTMQKDGKIWGSVPAQTSALAHSEERMECYTCHLSWTTSCAGCHLPVQANWKKTVNHFEGDLTRNWTSYNPQGIRVDQFILGLHSPSKGYKIAPLRSTSALVLSSRNINRERIYIQQPPLSSSGYSSQAFNPHFPHTVRKTETKLCTDCHISAQNDNNAWLQSVLGQGTNFVTFIGRFAWVAEGTSGLQAVAVTEEDEPQAVIGSYLHKLAYPDKYQAHKAKREQLQVAYNHHAENVLQVQLRGEYLFTANGSGGMRVYDVASVDNKGFSERFVTAPVSPLGQNTVVPSTFATAVALPTTMPVDPTRRYRDAGMDVDVRQPLPPEDKLPKAYQENQEQRMHEIYRYAFFTDKAEGLIVVNVDTLADRDPKNNFLRRAVTFNPHGQLTGAVNLTIAGTYAYVLCSRGLVVVDLNDPLRPQIIAEVGEPSLRNPRAVTVIFRYAFIVDDEGMKVVDVTFPNRPRAVPSATVPVAEAHDIYVARTYAYIAAGKQGLVIVDVERPEAPMLDQVYNADGQMNDARGVKVGFTNASLFIYVADGRNGLRVLQLTSPERTPWYEGFSPRPAPQLIATYRTHGPALAVSKGLDRDRAVDESGHQVSVFGRVGARPFNLEEMQRMYLRNGQIYTVTDTPPGAPTPAR
jgi:hypothetical protein